MTRRDLLLKNAKNGCCTTNIATLFNDGALNEFVKFDIINNYVSNGLKGVNDYFSNSTDFKGKVVESAEIDGNAYFKINVDTKVCKEQYDVNTGEYVGEIETTETYGYLLILRTTTCED